MTGITYIYDDRYLAWQLGDGHPTNPERARACIDYMAALRVPYEIVAPREATLEELGLAHSRTYVDTTLLGWNSEWSNRQTTLGRTARLMAGGTMLGVDMILAGEQDRVFNPQGAKHHAMYNTGSGFCVFNDMVMAAHRFVRAGRKVAYIDWDVHHGDGVQAGLNNIGFDLERGVGARTFSVFGHGFAAPTRLMTKPDGRHVHALLEDGSGDGPWLHAIGRFLDEIERDKPDVLLVATGADAHMTDPLGALRVTAEGYQTAGGLVNDLATALGIPVLMGGAGGYQPYTWTPFCWALVAQALAS